VKNTQNSKGLDEAFCFLSLLFVASYTGRSGGGGLAQLVTSLVASTMSIDAGPG